MRHDSSDGTSGSPLRTVRKATITLRAQASTERIVNIVGDCYPMAADTDYVSFSEPAALYLTNALDSGTVDAPIVYQKWDLPGRRSRLLGGLPLKTTAWVPSRNIAGAPQGLDQNVVAIDLTSYDLNGDPTHMWYGSGSPQQLLGKLSTAVFPNCAAAQAELFYQGEAMDLARYPNQADNFTAAWPNWLALGGGIQSSPPKVWFYPYGSAITDPPLTPCFDQATLDACMAWGTWSKHDNGCQAYASGWAQGTYTCSGCGSTSRSYQACDSAECSALCGELYAAAGQNNIDACASGCSWYATNIASVTLPSGSDSSVIASHTARVANWSGEANAFVHGYFGNEWADDYVRITGVADYRDNSEPTRAAISVDLDVQPAYGLQTVRASRL